MITFRNLALRRGGRLLLSGVDLTLHAGWRVGVVGRNGCGKSSLFAALLGRLDPDTGDIGLPARLRIASVAQETPGLPEPALDFVLAGDTALFAAIADERAAAARDDHAAVAEAHHRLEDLGGYDAEARAARLLHGLGFPADTHRNPVASFSGGWRMRLNLARALMAPSDLLLLDEPTNHLDLDAVLWLEEWLRRYAGTVLLISHDREFLDGVVDHVLHLHEGRARLYTGDYTGFERQRAEQLRQQQIAHDKEQAERVRLQRFVDRFKAKASKAKQAQSRMKRLEKLAGTEAVRAERGFSFAFPVPEKLPNPLLQLDHVDAGYPASSQGCSDSDAPVGAAHGCSRGAAVHAGSGPGDDGAGGHEQDRGQTSAPRSQPWAAPTEKPAVVVLRDVRFSLEPGDRIGLLGRNGAGKSTLVKTLAAEIAPLSGERRAHGELRIGYFAQHTVDALRAGESPFQHLRELAPRVSEQEARGFLGSWNFIGDRVFEPVDGFSGGERARLALALISWVKPNLLLLDEPTNHLDLDMREALADALQDFPGALVLVSHDRHLLGLVCDSYWRVAEGEVARFDGDLDDYARWLRSGASTPPRAPAGTGGAGIAGDRPAGITTRSDPAPPTEPASSRDRRRSAAEQRERERPLRQRLQRIEKRLSQLDVENAELHALLGDPSLYERGAEAVMERTRRAAELAREREQLEEEWLTVTAELEG
jgi:ATP-binding cassette subfamily F protein 3